MQRPERMGIRQARRYDEGVRRYFTSRSIGMHVTLLVLLPVFGWLTWWQLGRALGGNTLSWAYTFEWPLFAGYAVYVWWQLIHDTAVSPRRSGGRPLPDGKDAGGAGGEAGSLEPGWALTGGRRKNVAVAARGAVEEGQARGERFVPQTPEEAAELAEYNRYLAELNSDSDSDSDSGVGRR
jgi:hypothetical protein